MEIPRYLRPVIKKLEGLGCEIRAEQNNHVKVYVTVGDEKFIWTVAKTPSDHRANLNALATLKRSLRECGVEPKGLAMRSVRRLTSEHDRFADLFPLIEMCEAGIEAQANSAE